MNEKDFEKGVEKLKNVRMTHEEKTRLLKNILETSVESPYVKLSFFSLENFKYVRIATALLLIVAVSFGGMVYASGPSLPGDVLYPIKVNVVEPVLDKVNNSLEEKIVWEEEKVERRIQEAEKLAAREELDDERSEDLERRIEKSSRAFVKAVKEADGEKIEDRKNEFRKKFEILGDQETLVNPNEPDLKVEQSRGSSKVDRLKRIAIEAIDREDNGDSDDDDNEAED